MVKTLNNFNYSQHKMIWVYCVWAQTMPKALISLFSFLAYNSYIIQHRWVHMTGYKILLLHTELHDHVWFHKITNKPHWHQKGCHNDPQLKNLRENHGGVNPWNALQSDHVELYSPTRVRLHKCFHLHNRETFKSSINLLLQFL